MCGDGAVDGWGGTNRDGPGLHGYYGGGISPCLEIGAGVLKTSIVTSTQKDRVSLVRVLILRAEAGAWSHVWDVVIG